MMRVLLDEFYLEWDEAWNITSSMMCYTNHTILSEALEKWPIDYFRRLLPRIYMIIEEINRRFIVQARTKGVSEENIHTLYEHFIFEYYKNTLGKSKQEHFCAIYLDSSKKIVKEKVLFKGTVNHSMVHPREVFKEAYKCDATAIICIHNHPSGNVTPSRDDLETTAKLMEIGKLFNIHIIDHIIISDTGYYSFFENGDI